jgi:hypothetical protein
MPGVSAQLSRTGNGLGVGVVSRCLCVIAPADVLAADACHHMHERLTS